MTEDFKLLPNDRYSVQGFGRVGSYSSAKSGGYCRARKYWAIVFWDDSQNPIYKNSPLHYPYGWRECVNSPHFKTKREAENFLKEKQDDLTRSH